MVRPTTLGVLTLYALRAFRLLTGGGRVGFGLAHDGLDVPDDLLYTQACGVCRLLDNLPRQMAGIPMVVAYLATPPGNTHRL